MQNRMLLLTIILDMVYFVSFSQPIVKATLGERNDGVLISWTSSKINYRVLRAEVDDFSKAKQILGWQKKLSFLDKTAKKGVLYYYFVQSSSGTNNASTLVNKVGSRGFSGSIANFSATKGDINQTKISWVRPSKYSYVKLFWSYDKKFSNAKEITGWINNLSYIDKTAEKGSSVFYFIRLSNNKSGTGSILVDEIAEGYIGITNPDLHASGDAYGKTLNIGLSFSNDPEKKYYYQVLRSPDNNFKNAKPITEWLKQNVHRYVLTDPVPKYSTAYYYYVICSLYPNGKNASKPSSPKMTYAGNQMAWNLTTSHTPSYNYFRVNFNRIWGQFSKLYRSDTPDSTKAISITDWEWTNVLEDKDKSTKYGQPYYYWIVTSTNRGEHASLMKSVGIGYKLLNYPYSNNISNGTYTDRISMKIIPGWSNGDTFPFYFRIWRGSTYKPENLKLVRNWNQSLEFIDKILPNEAKQYYYFFESSRFKNGTYPSKLSPNGKVGWVKSTAGLNYDLSSELIEHSEYSPYPNPTNGTINIRGEIAQSKIAIYDNSGNFLKRLSSEKDLDNINLLNVSGLKPGEYIIRYSNLKGELLINRIMIE